MRIFKKVGVSWLFFLIFYCVLLISIVLFICQLGVSVLFYLRDGEFLFLWKNALFIALKKGSVAGLTLGIGIWVKAWLHELKKN